MNPIIQKFWEDQGYYDFRGGSALYNFFYLATHSKHKSGHARIIAEYSPHGTTHFINNCEYTEEEMLKIIKLKAFF